MPPGLFSRRPFALVWSFMLLRSRASRPTDAALAWMRRSLLQPTWSKRRLSTVRAALHTAHDHDLYTEVERALKGPCGVTRGGTAVLIAVSGGSDSMALLHLMHEVRSRWVPPLHVEVVHFNHGLRVESEEEERFVVGECERMGVGMHVVRWGQGKGGKGMQDRARQWRRTESTKLLGEMVAGDGNEGVIATAHHADDQVETFMLKLLRGAHISRLRGMDARNGAFIKPLLEVTKNDLVDLLTARSLEWREDASNQGDTYKRNRLRLRVLPELAGMAGGMSALRQRIEDLSTQSRAVEGWVETEARAWEQREGVCDSLSRGQLPLKEAEGLPQLVREAVVRRFVHTQAGIGLSYAQVQRVLQHVEGSGNQWSLYVADDWVVERTGDVLRVHKAVSRRGSPAYAIGDDDEDIEEGDGGADDGEMALPVHEPATHIVDIEQAGVSVELPVGWHVEAMRTSDMNAARAADGRIILYNVPIGARLRIRGRREGDRFNPAWKERPVKLKDFLRGQKVPLHMRNDMPLVCFAGGSSDDDDASVEHEEILAVYPTHVCRRMCADAGLGFQPLCIKILRLT